MKNKYRSDLAIAKNLGSAGSGSAHWWHQRVTGVVLTIATIWLICFSWNLSGLEVSGIIEVVKKPYNIVMLILFTMILFHSIGHLHLRILYSQLHREFIKMIYLNIIY
jgi:succinate dehydrogenase / fumarate reductase membrane anchor subunit